MVVRSSYLHNGISYTGKMASLYWFSHLDAWISAGGFMMTSSTGNIFRVTGPLWRKHPGHRWIPFTKASEAKLWCFLWCAPEQTIEQRWSCRWFETPLCPCDVTVCHDLFPSHVWLIAALYLCKMGIWNMNMIKIHTVPFNLLYSVDTQLITEQGLISETHHIKEWVQRRTCFNVGFPRITKLVTQDTYFWRQTISTISKNWQ